MKFLDTTFLIDHQHGTPQVESYLKAHENETFVTSVLNLKEVAVGRFMTQTPSPTQQDIRDDFHWLQVEPFSLSHGLAAAEIEADLRNDDRHHSISATDIFIGGVAKTLNAPVVTRNTQDFDLFFGVAVETY
jgi:predicted nucleic acid-binding protein